MQVTAQMVNTANATAQAKIDNNLLAQKEEKILRKVAKDVKIDGL